MRLKSYFAETVEAAIGMARDELGSEAMLVNSRRTSPETKGLGAYEVVFASLPAGGRIAEPCAAAGAETVAGEVHAAGWGRSAGSDLVLEQLAGLQHQIRAMRRAIWRTGAAGAEAAGYSSSAEALSRLAEAEVEPELAAQVAAAVERSLAGGPACLRYEPDYGRLEEALADELASRLCVDATLGRQESRRIVALVGPPGCGKTTTLVKLAVTHGLANGLRIHLASLDTCRIAAGDQLRSYAALLGIGCQVLETGRELRVALEELTHHDLILIDTPGYSSGEWDDALDLAASLADIPEVEVQLILPASMKSADLTHAVDRFEIFRPNKLMFTRLDETGTFGPVYSEAVRTRKPVSFLAGGQRVPDDLEPATVEGITGRVCGRRPGRVFAAA